MRLWILAKCTLIGVAVLLLFGLGVIITNTGSQGTSTKRQLTPKVIKELRMNVMHIPHSKERYMAYKSQDTTDSTTQYSVTTPAHTARKLKLPPANTKAVFHTVKSPAPYSIDRGRKYQTWLYSPAPLPYNASLVGEQQLERHSRVVKVCNNNDIEFAFSKRTGRPIGRSAMWGKEQLLFCPILKAGSTNILRLLCWLSGPPCSEIKHLKPHNMVPKYLTNYGSIATKNSVAFRDKFSFAIVRNPWKRLVSVYIQKFVETRQGAGFCQFRERLPDVHRDLRKKMLTHEPWHFSFNQYLKDCVIGQYEEGGILAQNGHWRPQYHMCSFCLLDYTFIGKMETMQTDERVILNEFGFQDIDATIKAANEKLLPNEKGHKTSLLYEDLWAEVAVDTLDKLREIYAMDFEMFDYPTAPL